jgi:predicted deacylase
MLAGPAAAEWVGIDLLGERVEPGNRRELALVTSQTFAGSFVSTPVVVARGTAAGPTLCLVAGIHGDELNGIEIVRRVLEAIDPRELRGTLIGVPIANVHGFRRSSRYLPDRRDLNRFFPGKGRGSAASRIAYRLFESVFRSCEWLVDFHTGSFHRINLPQVRADLRNEEIRRLALEFGADTVVHSLGSQGTLRRAASEAGIVAITYEAGEPMKLDEEEVTRGEQAVLALLQKTDLSGTQQLMRQPPRVFFRSRWIRSDDGGILFSQVELGDAVRPGEVLGTVTDPLTNERASIRSSFRGLVIGMAVNQVVIPGFAAFHVGLDSEAGPPDAAEETPERDEIDQLDEPFEIDERPE